MGQLSRLGRSRNRPVPQALGLARTYPCPTGGQGWAGRAQEREEEEHDKGGRGRGGEEGCGVDLQGSEEGLSGGQVGLK